MLSSPGSAAADDMSATPSAATIATDRNLQKHTSGHTLARAGSSRPGTVSLRRIEDQARVPGRIHAGGLVAMSASSCRRPTMSSTTPIGKDFAAVRIFPSRVSPPGVSTCQVRGALTDAHGYELCDHGGQETEHDLLGIDRSREWSAPRRSQGTGAPGERATRRGAARREFADRSGSISRRDPLMAN